jgi:hypothetical protein
VCAHVLLNPFEGLRIPSRGPWRVGIEYFGVGGTLYCTGNTLDTISRSVRFVFAILVSVKNFSLIWIPGNKSRCCLSDERNWVVG